MSTSINTHAQQHDPQLQPELIGGNAGIEATEPGPATEQIANDQSKDDRPQHVLDVGQRPLVGLTQLFDPCLGQLAGVAQPEQ
nr:hypothetical protein [Kallotenue papyrolyticum]